jgi:hypothetical protein
MEILIAVGLGILASCGGLWYTVGRLTSEVKGHNKRLDKMDAKLDTIINGQGGKNAA